VAITRITRTDPMRSTVNRGLMVSWINADLIERASCDVRRSIVLYDADGMFVHALDAGIGHSYFAEILHTMADGLENAGVTSWSIGVV